MATPVANLRGPQGPAGPALVPPRTMSATTTASVSGIDQGDMQITATGNPTITPTGTPNGRMMVVEVLASGAERVPTMDTDVILTRDVTDRSLTVPQNAVGIFGLRYSALRSAWILLSATITN